MPHEFRAVRRVEFSDTDMAGIVHFSNFFRYMESTEHEFFRSLGQTLHSNEGGRMRGWARVHAECDYKSPLRYPESFDVQLVVREKRSSSLSYEFLFTRTEGGELVARGALTVVCVERDPDEGRMRPAPMPASIAEAVDVAPNP